MSTSQITAIIVSYNTCNLLRQCLLSVQPELASLEAEVIVVDNASSDGSLEMLRSEFPWVHLLALEMNAGFGAANNQAATFSVGKYLLLLNSDTVVQQGALRALLEFAEAQVDAGAIGAQLLNADASLQRSCWRFPTLWRVFAEGMGLLKLFGRPSNYTVSDYLHPMKVDFAIGACLLLRRDVFELVGGFDEDFFMYAEETDLCRRIRRHGKYVYYTPAAKVVHLGGGSSTTPIHQLQQFQTSQDLYFQKHYGTVGLGLYHLLSIFNSLLRLVVWELISKVSIMHRSVLQERLAKQHWLLSWHIQALRTGNHVSLQAES